MNMTNLFSKISERNANFQSLVNEKNLTEVIKNFSHYSRSSTIAVVSDLKENEKVEQFHINKLGPSYSVFAEISNPNSPSRFCHCGSSSIENLAIELKENLEKFFTALYK